MTRQRSASAQITEAQITVIYVLSIVNLSISTINTTGLAMDVSHVLLPAELLQRSPSSKEGVESTEELLHRAFGCELIQEGGILLRLPQVVMATAQNLFHRFFYRFDIDNIANKLFMKKYLTTQQPCSCARKSLKRFDATTVAMGSILLATKIEEKPKILREVWLKCFLAALVCPNIILVITDHKCFSPYVPTEMWVQSM